MSEAIITLEGLAIGYDGQAVLSGISLAIARASFTAILGTNGSGKSTLLKTLIGLIPAISGRIRVARSVTFGYVPQAVELDSLYPLTGFDVALMGAYGRISAGRLVSPAERSFTRDCLRATAAESFASERFAELSGGQKQRVLIARALVTKPDVLVLDEPTAGVDAAATHALLEFISQIHEERKLTVLLVTHDLPLVRKHAQQVVWLHEGEVVHGTVADLFTPERMAEVFEMEIG
ncbi:MAG TPA: metal ABC transporter ATP-binding protein [Verrucomicrobiae bacterium]|nr:metal ABC transporter ATP-binding protein [Verrucomicrobiae bacterium]